MEMALLSEVFINISLKYISKTCFALETRRIFHIFDPLWRQQSNSQVLNWWRSKWTNLASNQSGLGSLLNKREKNKITKNKKKNRLHPRTSKVRTNESVYFYSFFFYCWQYYRCLPFPLFTPSSKTSILVHPILMHQLCSLLRILLSISSPDISLELQTSPLGISGAPQMH